MTGQVKRLLLPGSSLFPAVEGMLSQGLAVVFTVTGRSMWPLIRHNRDSVQLVLPSRKPRKGDIVLLKTPPPHPRYVLHRVYRIKGGSLVTLGDGCLSADPPVPLGSIIGHVNVVIRGGRDIPCDSLWFRFLGRAWMFLLPVRSPLMGFICRLRGISMASLRQHEERDA